MEKPNWCQPYWQARGWSPPQPQALYFSFSVLWCIFHRSWQLFYLQTLTDLESIMWSGHQAVFCYKTRYEFLQSCRINLNERHKATSDMFLEQHRCALYIKTGQLKIVPLCPVIISPCKKSFLLFVSHFLFTGRPKWDLPGFFSSPGWAVAALSLQQRFSLLLPWQ